MFRSVRSGHDHFSKIFGKCDGQFAMMAEQGAAGAGGRGTPMDVDATTADFSGASVRHPPYPQPNTHMSYDYVDKYISFKLKEIEHKFRGEPSLEESEGCFMCDEVRKSSMSWSPVGRLGPAHVMFDVSTNVGSLIIDCDRLGISSHSGFSSIRATVGVFRGKWQYEICLNSKGVMQVGWATHKCRFSQEKGVGDTENSYAYDG